MFNVRENVEVGDTVLYAQNPGSTDWFAAHVISVTDETLTVAVMSGDSNHVRFSPRSAVRHYTDPIFVDPLRVAAMQEDEDGGCFKLHPKTALLKKLAEDLGVMVKSELAAKEEFVDNTKPAPAAFRIDEGPALDEAAKALRKQLLAEVK